MIVVCTAIDLNNYNLQTGPKQWKHGKTDRQTWEDRQTNGRTNGRIISFNLTCICVFQNIYTYYIETHIYMSK